MGSRISRAAIYDVLNAYQVPGANANLVALKAVKAIDVEEAEVIVRLQLLDAYQDREQVVREALGKAIGAIAGVEKVTVAVEWERTPQAEFKNLLPTVKKCYVVASGKGGWGRAPSLPTWPWPWPPGLQGGAAGRRHPRPEHGHDVRHQEGPRPRPRARSFPWRSSASSSCPSRSSSTRTAPSSGAAPCSQGPHPVPGGRALGRPGLPLHRSAPGTGDTQISLIQNAKVDGAVIVSTPQDVAFLDARKAIGLFQTVKVPITGVVENMSSFHCPSCHVETQSLATAA